MYQVGNTVMHPSEGICAVENIRRMRFGTQEREYYVLRPTMENGSSTVYLPIERGTPCCASCSPARTSSP